MTEKVTAVGSRWLAASSQKCTCSCITSCVEFFGKTSNHPGDSAPYSPDLALCSFWLFPKWKSPLKGRSFQTINKIQETMTRQLMATGRTVWGDKVPTVKGTEMSLSYVQCFLYLRSSSINVSIFHSTWLDTFWTDCMYIYMSIYLCLGLRNVLFLQNYLWFA